MNDPLGGEMRVVLCDSSASCGDHVCCLPAGHGGGHESREWRKPNGSLFASWDDYSGDEEPYACAHEEMEHVGTDGGWPLVRCTRCGERYRQVDDPDGPIHLTELHPRRERRIRYESVSGGPAVPRGKDTADG